MFANYPDDEKNLISRISQGDRTAFAELYDFYKDKVYAIALKISHSTNTAEEIVQDIFLKIWSRRESLTDIQNISAYIFVVTRNHAYRTLKQIAKRFETNIDFSEESELDGIESDGPLNLIIQKEYNSILQKAIDKLPEQQKLVYNLIKEKGLKRKEAAELLKIKPDTVKFHLAHALKNIRTYCAAYLNLKSLLIALSVGRFL